MTDIDMLQSVLNDAHKGHTYVTDSEQYGLPDYWEASLVGDCEDFALWCRDRLKEKGIESNLVYCKTETGGHHLVLSVDGYILDNRSLWVRSRNDVPYKWISIRLPNGAWYSIEG